MIRLLFPSFLRSKTQREILLWFSLDPLKDGQLELKELTSASLDKLLDGHEALRAQQGKLYEGQEQVESSLRDNLMRLGQEKALIASGQELVAQLIQGITQKMGEDLQRPGGFDDLNPQNGKWVLTYSAICLNHVGKDCK